VCECKFTSGSSLNINYSSPNLRIEYGILNTIDAEATGKFDLRIHQTLTSGGERNRERLIRYILRGVLGMMRANLSGLELSSQ